MIKSSSLLLLLMITINYVQWIVIVCCLMCIGHVTKISRRLHYNQNQVMNHRGYVFCFYFHFLLLFIIILFVLCVMYACVARTSTPACCLWACLFALYLHTCVLCACTYGVNVFFIFIFFIFLFFILFFFQKIIFLCANPWPLFHHRGRMPYQQWFHLVLGQSRDFSTPAPSCTWRAHGRSVGADVGPTQTNPGMHHPRMDRKSRPTEFQAPPWAVALSVFDQEHNIT